MTRIRKAAAALVMAALISGGAATAHAVTTQTNFNGDTPRFQQSRYFVFQNKSTTSDSKIKFSQIGSTYLMNVKAERAGGTQYAEKKSLGRDKEYTITNETPTGVQTRLIVTNSTWAVVDVSIAGWFKTN